MHRVVKCLFIYSPEQELILVSNTQTAKFKSYEHRSCSFLFAHQTSNVMYGKSHAILLSATEISKTCPEWRHLGWRLFRHKKQLQDKTC